MEIEVYSDVVCPWCFIGSERLKKVLAKWTAETAGEAKVTYKPFMLRPDAPEAGIDIAAMLKQRTGKDAKELFAHAENAAKESGLALDLSKQPRMYPTAGAHTLLRHAIAKGTQPALATALYRAHFEEAKAINDPSVLAELASAHGFTQEEARALLADPKELAQTQAEAEHAARQGIRGVPFFIFNSKLAVSGAQPEEILRQALNEAA